jgi:hypothetical protein
MFGLGDVQPKGGASWVGTVWPFWNGRGAEDVPACSARGARYGALLADDGGVWLGVVEAALLRAIRASWSWPEPQAFGKRSAWARRCLACNPAGLRFNVFSHRTAFGRYRSRHSAAALRAGLSCTAPSSLASGSLRGRSRPLRKGTRLRASSVLVRASKPYFGRTRAHELVFQPTSVLSPFTVPPSSFGSLPPTGAPANGRGCLPHRRVLPLASVNRFDVSLLLGVLPWPSLVWPQGPLGRLRRSSATDFVSVARMPSRHRGHHFDDRP